MKIPKLNVIFKERVYLGNVDKWKMNLTESCFQIELSASLDESEDSSGVLVKMKCRPLSNEGYELLLDYQLEVDDNKEFVEFDKWEKPRDLFELKSDNLAFNVCISVNIREILAPQNLSVSTSYRNFHVMASQSSFYVNTMQLNSLGGKLFRDWYEREAEGQNSAVVQSLNADELGTLLNAACAYSTPIITRHNFDCILEIARRFYITGLLRLAETFLIECFSIHRIRKLEYAVEYRMARLVDSVLRSFVSNRERIECLLEYLSQNGETLADLHPEVMEMCEIYADCIVL